jgi:hypothetical protein
MSFFASPKKSRTSFRRRAFLVESLESRSLLAGDLMSSLDASGNLFLTGDAKANNIDISYDSTLGAYVLTGVNTNIHNLAGLSVPSLTLNAATLAGFDGALNINLKAGNDTLTINGNAANDLASSLTVNGDVGNDVINLIGNNTHVAGDVAIMGSAGNDTIVVSNVTAAGNVSITGNAGNDSITVDTVTAAGAGVTVGSAGNVALSIDGGADNDNVSVNAATTTTAGMSISSGLGSDQVSVTNVNANGDLTVNISGTVKKKDHDQLTIDTATATNVNVTVHGTGHHTVAISNITFGTSSSVGGVNVAVSGHGNADVSV